MNNYIGKPGLRVFSFLLPNDRMAELRITGPVTQDDFEVLARYLEVTKAVAPKSADEAPDGRKEEAAQR